LVRRWIASKLRTRWAVATRIVHFWRCASHPWALASIVAAKRFLDAAQLEDRRERALKAAQIALDNFQTQFPSDYKAQFAPDTDSPFYKMADAILAAIDEGEL
jgi:hypothetical protein